jgi:hypothetical protein
MTEMFGGGGLKRLRPSLEEMTIPTILLLKNTSGSFRWAKDAGA